MNEQPVHDATSAGDTTTGGADEMADVHAPDILLTPAEVARLFRVNPKTVTRWAQEGKIAAVRTLGGHHRFRRSRRP